MSESSDKDLDLNLHFLPDWAKQSSEKNIYEKYSGGDDSRSGKRHGNRRRDDRGDGRKRPDSRGGFKGDRDRNRGGNRKFDRSKKFERPAPEPLPEIKISFVAEEKGLDSLARQIKLTGRAFPLFEIAQMILQKPTRHSVCFETLKNSEGGVKQALFSCALDDSVWLSEDEAVKHVLKHHFDAFYQVEKIPCDPPKGTYTFVAQCGFSGVILGPPNHHDYQNQLKQLHAQRFSRMPFDKFKSNVKIVREEEVVQKWIEEQSFKTEYICLNLPEADKLESMEAVEKHFREVHLSNIIKPVTRHSISGEASRKIVCKSLQRAVNSSWSEQRRFPLKVVHVLSQQFASRGLQFFKIRKSFTYVSVARPHYLDLEHTTVSDGIRKIVEFIAANPESNRKQLIEALAPSPAVEPPAPTNEATQTETPDKSAEPEAAKPAPPTPEQQVVISDLHWLVHQGHVIEFANGILENAKKPVVQQPKPKKAEPQTPVPEEKPAAAEPTAPAEVQQPKQEPEAVNPPALETPVQEPVSEPVAESPETASEAPKKDEPVSPAGEQKPATPPAESSAAPDTEPAPAEPENKDGDDPEKTQP